MFKKKRKKEKQACLRKEPAGHSYSLPWHGISLLLIQSSYFKLLWLMWKYPVLTTLP
jgi:hypothetical protein